MSKKENQRSCTFRLTVVNEKIFLFSCSWTQIVCVCQRTYICKECISAGKTFHIMSTSFLETKLLKLRSLSLMCDAFVSFNHLHMRMMNCCVQGQKKIYFEKVGKDPGNPYAVSIIIKLNFVSSLGQVWFTLKSTFHFYITKLFNQVRFKLNMVIILSVQY